MKPNPEEDPTRRLYFAQYEITENEIKDVFQQNPWCDVILMPDGSRIFRDNKDKK